MVTLQTFYLGKLDLWTVYLKKLLSVTDFSLGNLPRRNFYRLGLRYVSRTIECPLKATPKRQLGKNEVGSQLSAKVLMTSVRNISEIKEKNVFLISKISLGKGGGGYSPKKVMGVPIGKFREHL